MGPQHQYALPPHLRQVRRAAYLHPGSHYLWSHTVPTRNYLLRLLGWERQGRGPISSRGAPALAREAGDRLVPAMGSPGLPVTQRPPPPPPPGVAGTGLLTLQSSAWEGAFGRQWEHSTCRRQSPQGEAHRRISQARKSQKPLPLQQQPSARTCLRRKARPAQRKDLGPHVPSVRNLDP